MLHVIGQSLRLFADYTGVTEASRVGTRAIRSARQFAIAHDQNSRSEPAVSGGGAWSRKRHAAASARSGAAGSADASVAFDNLAPRASTAIGTCR